MEAGVTITLDGSYSDPSELTSVHLTALTEVFLSVSSYANYESDIVDKAVSLKAGSAGSLAVVFTVKLNMLDFGLVNNAKVSDFTKSQGVVDTSAWLDDPAIASFATQLGSDVSAE